MLSYKTNEIKLNDATSVALGCFDGVHIGHAAVISEAVGAAKRHSLKSAVWCFDSPPKNFFVPSSAPLLTAFEQKEAAIEALGVDVLICVPFGYDIAELTPEDFVKKILVEKLCAKHVVCGFNFSFGKNGEGNTEILASLCRKYDITFTFLPPSMYDGEPISSSVIRSALLDGDAQKASSLLGRPYSVSATVIDGNHIGRTLGFPTANIEFEHGVLVPKNGVYVTRISCEDGKYFGITNVGTHPTVFPKKLLAETNIFDFNGDLYRKKITLEFLEFIRAEKKFPSLKELSAQVSLDVAAAKSALKKYSL